MFYNYKLGDLEKCVFCGFLEGNTKEHLEKEHPIKLSLIYSPTEFPDIEEIK